MSAPTNFADVNCIQVLAPSIACGDNAFGGFYTSGEHIGHLSREYSCAIAEFLDDDKTGCFLFQCHLAYSDTNHTRAGYDVELIISSDSKEGVDQLFSTLEALNLNPRR